MNQSCKVKGKISIKRGSSSIGTSATKNHHIPRSYNRVSCSRIIKPSSRSVGASVTKNRLTLRSRNSISCIRIIVWATTQHFSCTDDRNSTKDEHSQPSIPQLTSRADYLVGRSFLREHRSPTTRNRASRRRRSRPGSHAGMGSRRRSACAHPR